MLDSVPQVGILAGLALAATVTMPSGAVAQARMDYTTVPTAYGRSTPPIHRRHEEGLHFSHPIFTESVSPDTKLRFDGDRTWADDGSESELGVEGEYAFNRSFSLEVELPYGFINPDGGSSSSGLGNLEAKFKFANFAFEENNLLLGYGLTFEVPTGDATAGTGSDHIWGLEPFLNIGYKSGRIELVGWGRFPIPTRLRATDDEGTEFRYDFAALYHILPTLQGLVELNGSTGIGANSASGSATSAAVGAKVELAPHLLLGAGVAVPLNDSEQHARLRISVFRHF